MTVEKSDADIAASIELLEILSSEGSLQQVLNAAKDDMSPLYGRFGWDGDPATVGDLREEIYDQPILKLAAALDDVLADAVIESNLTVSEVLAVMARAMVELVKPPPPLRAN